jgi:hypothetical protein
MSASFARLCQAVPPPVHPSEAGSTQAFARVEDRLDLELPDAYKQLVTAYGTGSWRGFLWVLNPFSANRSLNLLDQAVRQLDAERVIRRKWPDQVPFPLYPEPGGLFPWGMTDNGDRLYWLTEGLPDSWPTIVFESRGPRFDRHERTCCDLLLGWLVGRIKILVFPEDFDACLSNAFHPGNPA